MHRAGVRGHMDRSQRRKTAWEARRSAAERYRRVNRDARRLLRKHASPSRRGPGKPKKGEAPSILFSKVVGLLEECAANSIPPPDSLVALISSSLPAKEPSLTAKQRKGVEREIRPGWDAWRKAEPGGWPVPAQRVAGDVSVTPRTVYNWRVDPKYRLACESRLTEIVVKKLSDRAFPKNAVREESSISPKEQLRQLAAYADSRWPGPTKSPIDGKVYNTAEEYALHLLEHGGKFAKPKP